MKRFGILFLSIFAFGLLSSNKPETKQQPVEQVSIWYGNALIELSNSIREMDNGLGENDSILVVQHYFTCRENYKKIEFLFFYLNAQEVETFINGAPLPKLQKDTDLPTQIDPQGFQVVDELMGEDFSKETIAELHHQLRSLRQHVGEIAIIQSEVKLTDRQLFEAMRQGLLTISTLGISGFDTPGTSRAFVDASTSLEHIKWTFSLYSDELKESGFSEYASTIKTFDKALKFLDGKDFETFDRFTFTRDYLNVLSENLLNAQIALNIEFNDEIGGLPTAVNMRSAHLYSPDFLNDEYFARTNGFTSTPELQELGKILFFDPILSANNQRACASCHSPELGFSENRSKSLGFDGKSELGRNAMVLTNAIHSERFFYDLRAGSLFAQFEHVIRNEGEFHTSFIELEEKLSGCEEYVGLFQKAFETTSAKISQDQINAALGVYVSSLKSYDSDFDRMMRNQQKMDKEVADGYNLFMGKAMCGTCHFPPTFAGLRPPFYMETESEVIGVTETEDLQNPVLDADLGRRRSGRPFDDISNYDHSFKTVSLRNAKLSAPYFHNGAFTSLEKVMEFYNAGGGAGLGLDLPNQTLPFDSLNLTEEEQQKIIRFMESLTDVKNLTSRPADVPGCNVDGQSERIIGGKY